MKRIQEKYNEFVEIIHKFGLYCEEINGFLAFGEKHADQLMKMWGSIYITFIGITYYRINILEKNENNLMFANDKERFIKTLTILVPDYRKKFLAYEKMQIKKERKI